MMVIRILRLDSPAALTLQNATVERVEYQGRPALRVVEQEVGQGGLAALPHSDFTDGVIETDVVGLLRPDAPQDMRGFVGIAFRVQPNAERYECFFLRPTNARADDQLRRNHSTQYIAHPDYPWYRLREDAPGVYESYADLEPGAWTRVKITAQGLRARLYVGGAEQPCLVVNDLKLGAGGGQIALWIGAGTEAYFSDVSVSADAG